MAESAFDGVADDYAAQLAASIASYGEPVGYFAEYKIREVAREVGRLAEADPADGFRQPLSICDFGAGIGSSVPYFHKYFPEARLTCLDVSLRSLEVAEKRWPGLAQFVHSAGETLPLPSSGFDIAFAACVFHHIDAVRHVPALRELHRILRPGGRLFLFEHNPWNPLTVRVVESCPFDANACLISAPSLKRRLIEAGFPAPATRYRLFFPHVLRALRPLEPALSWLPLGGQYFLIAPKAPKAPKAAK